MACLLSFIDQEKNKAYLARDRFGQKPLYFTKRTLFYFASEIKAILSTGVIILLTMVKYYICKFFSI